MKMRFNRRYNFYLAFNGIKCVYGVQDRNWEANGLRQQKAVLTTTQIKLLLEGSRRQKQWIIVSNVYLNVHDMVSMKNDDNLIHMFHDALYVFTTVNDKRTLTRTQLFFSFISIVSSAIWICCCRVVVVGVFVYSAISIVAITNSIVFE